MGLVGCVRDHRDHEQQRGDQKVLEQQDGEDRAAGQDVEAAFFRQHRHDDGGGGQSQRGAQHDGGGLGEAEAARDEIERPAADGDLQGAEAENIAPQQHEALQRQFQSDVEHQEDHAEGGDGGHAVAGGEEGQVERDDGVEPAHHMGADHHSRDQEAQHRAEAQAPEQRHGDACHAQKEQRRLVGLQIELRDQLRSPGKTR